MAEKRYYNKERAKENIPRLGLHTRDDKTPKTHQNSLEILKITHRKGSLLST